MFWNKKDFKVIAVTGEPSSGKDTFAKIIEEKGFKHISLGDFLRGEATKVGVALDRPTLSAFTSKMRGEKGLQYPVDVVSETINENTVISGFRNRKEVEYLREKFGNKFTFVAVTATPEIRFERMKKRGRVGDNLTFEEFKKEDAADRNNGTGTHEVDVVMNMADYKIDNSGGEEEFVNKVENWFSYNFK